MSTNLHVIALVPAFALSDDEIESTLERLPQFITSRLVILNDSSPAAKLAVEGLFEKGKCDRLVLPFQVGKAEAMRQGIKYALSDQSCDAMIQIDGDLKQSPEDVSLIYSALAQGAELVICDRYAYQDLSSQSHRRAISGVLSRIMAHLTEYAFVDYVCGMRGYTRRLADRYAALRCHGYALEIEQVLLAWIAKATVECVPIKSNRQADWTPAEKIEDNLGAILVYADELGIDDTCRGSLSFVLTQIKARRTFSADLSDFGINEHVEFGYSDGRESLSDCYNLRYV